MKTRLGGIVATAVMAMGVFYLAGQITGAPGAQSGAQSPNGSKPRPKVSEDDKGSISLEAGWPARYAGNANQEPGDIQLYFTIDGVRHDVKDPQNSRDVKLVPDRNIIWNRPTRITDWYVWSVQMDPNSTALLKHAILKVYLRVGNNSMDVGCAIKVKGSPESVNPQPRAKAIQQVDCRASA